ncbi:BatD family protein [Persicobacter psychrovividus]
MMIRYGKLLPSLQVGLLMVLLSMLVFPDRSMGQALWSDVQVNKSTIFVGEPFQVTIAVYTSTWFTRGIDPGNIKVEGAYSIYFRPENTSFTKDGQTYVGVKLIYNVIPHKAGPLIFPALDITVESPAKGDFKGKKHRLKTKPKTVTVRNPPANVERKQWMVANSTDVREFWNVQGNQVKVGDVIQRKITISVSGTVAEMIPAVDFLGVNNLRIYPQRAVTNNQKGKRSFGGMRTEQVQYLFEKEGEVIIPSITVNWFDPVRKKLFKKTLKEKRFTVAPNPNLGMLTTTIDSLENAQKQSMGQQEQKAAWHFLGLTIKQLIVISLLLCLVLLLLNKFYHPLKARYVEYWSLYKNTEPYYFHQFMSALKSNDPNLKINKLYLWLTKLPIEMPTIECLNQKIKDQHIDAEQSKIAQYYEGNEQELNLDANIWKAARKDVVTKRGRKVPWVNP